MRFYEFSYSFSGNFVRRRRMDTQIKFASLCDAQWKKRVINFWV